MIEPILSSDEATIDLIHNSKDIIITYFLFNASLS